MDYLWIVLVPLFVFAVYLFLIFPAIRRHPDRKLMENTYIAHRGLHSLKPNTPENSIAAFKAAIEAGIAIETDIHITKDNEVVVFHDDTLKRMCGDEREIEKLTLNEIKKLRLAGTNEQIPTLKEVLDLVDGKVPLLIEFKSISLDTTRRLCPKANELLEDYKGKYFVQSFFPFVLGWYRKNRKDVIRGQLSSGFGKNELLSRRLLGMLVFNFIARPDFVSYDYQYENKFGRRLCIFLGAHSAGWTFRDADTARAFSAIFTTRIFEGFLPETEDK
ncbi:MAG: glycerophosphodiester phosphodiesterase [Oscillospiraceae bacterium]|nr:glycerophosphodiester phosphodiesterase [Oscillospiraceae bacterium]